MRVDTESMAAREFSGPMRGRRIRGVKRTQKLVGERGTCRMYGFGVTGPDPTQSWLPIIAGTAAVTLPLILLVHALVPIAVLLYFVRWGVNRPRGVCVADEGIAVTKESWFDAHVTSVVVLVGLDALSAVTAATKTHVRVQLGAEQVWLRNREHETLLRAAAAINPEHVAAAPTVASTRT